MKHASKIRVMLVDDHFVVRAGLVGALTLDAEIEIVAECDSGEQAIAACRKRRPDLVLMDWRLLEIAEVTVKFHVGNLLEKLGAADRTQAATAAIQRGIIHLD